MKHIHGSDKDISVDMEPSNFLLPMEFNYKAYRNAITEHFNQMKSFYGNTLEYGDTTEEYVIDLESFTRGLLGESQITKKIAIQKLRVFSLLQEHSFEKCKVFIEDFFRKVESLVRLDCYLIRFKTIVFAGASNSPSVR